MNRRNFLFLCISCAILSLADCSRLHQDRGWRLVNVGDTQLFLSACRFGVAHSGIDTAGVVIDSALPGFLSGDHGPCIYFHPSLFGKNWPTFDASDGCNHITGIYCKRGPLLMTRITCTDLTACLDPWSVFRRTYHSYLNQISEVSYRSDTLILSCFGGNSLLFLPGRDE